MTAIQSKAKLSDFDSSQGLNRGASKFKEMAWYIIKVLFFLSALPYPSSLKSFLLRSFGAQVGKGLVIKPRVNIHFPWKLKVGSNVWIGEEAWLLNFELFDIGDNVCISQRSFLCGGNHNYKIPSMPYRNGPITIKDGAWIGACCFVGPNVTVGIDTVVTAGSLVVSDVDSNIVVTRIPAEQVRKRW